MQGEFKQCPNGHYYQGDNCPYCKNNNRSAGPTTSSTEIYVGNTDGDFTNNPDQATTIAYGGSGGTTTIIDGQETVVNGNGKGATVHNRTVFGDEDSCARDSNIPGTRKETRYSRRLVGWLVSYSFDELGVDYKLYEGRNIIGRDADCNITVNDGRMSGKHAVLLFRANKYSLTDSQSSHGTFVNDVDIELEPHYLKDGDIIRMGNTVFKFRTSL